MAIFNSYVSIPEGIQNIRGYVNPTELVLGAPPCASPLFSGGGLSALKRSLGSCGQAQILSVVSSGVTGKAVVLYLFVCNLFACLLLCLFAHSIQVISLPSKHWDVLQFARKEEYLWCERGHIGD